MYRVVSLRTLIYFVLVKKKVQVIISAQYLKFLISISDKWANSPKIDRLITYCFLSHSRIFHSDMNVTIASEFEPLIAVYTDFEHEGIFIVSYLLWHGTSVYTVSSKGPPLLVTSYDKPGVLRTYSNPDPHGFLWVTNGNNKNTCIWYASGFGYPSQHQ